MTDPHTAAGEESSLTAAGEKPLSNKDPAEPKINKILKKISIYPHTFFSRWIGVDNFYNIEKRKKFALWPQCLFALDHMCTCVCVCVYQRERKTGIPWSFRQYPEEIAVFNSQHVNACTFKWPAHSVWGNNCPDGIWKQISLEFGEINPVYIKEKKCCLSKRKPDDEWVQSVDRCASRRRKHMRREGC